MINKYAAAAAVGLLCLAGQASATNATVGETSPCASQGLVGASSPMDFGDSNYLIPLIIVGAVVIAGIIAVSDGSDDAPVSP